MKAIFNRSALEDIHRRCLDLGARKSNDYGAVGDAIAMGGVRGVVVRNLDKQLRCMSLTEPDHFQAVNDESLKDTLMDMINYATYAVALLEGTWGREPLPTDPDFHVEQDTQAKRAIKACEMGARLLEAGFEINKLTDIGRAIIAGAEVDLPF